MKRYVACMVVTLTMFGGGLVGDVSAIRGQQNVSIEVVGIAMTKPDPQSEYGWSYVQGRHPGTEVHIRLTAAGSTILSVATGEPRGDSKIRLATAEGKQLKPVRGMDFDFFSNISEDGQHCVLPFRSEELPPAGTSALRLSGSVKLTTGSDLQSQRVRIDVKPGALVDIGKIQLKLSEVEEDMFGENAWTVTFQSSQSLATIREIKFFDDAGNEIESSSAGSHSFGFGNQMTYAKSFRIMGKPAAVNVDVNYFASTQEIEVPLNLTFELNLSK